jgi:hypothetical protein
MRDWLERLLLMSDSEVLALRAQAAKGPVRKPERSQSARLMRHFLERFFNHESASPDGDAKTRVVQVALVAGLPPFVVALYLWPVYHSFTPHVRNHHTIWMPGPPPYWAQVNHHFFFVIYAFVVLGIAAVFEWDLFFPDALDIFILKPLPVPDRATFLARVAAIAILLGALLFDANILAGLVLPEAIDPPNLARFLAGHILATGGAGLSAALFVLAFESIVLSVFGELWFRRIALLMQGLAIALLLMLLLLFPVFSGVVPVLLQPGQWLVRWLPPFWFLGMYERLMEGPAALPIYGQLARTGCLATLAAGATVILTYPVAYLRRTRQIVEGVRSNRAGRWVEGVIARVVNVTIAGKPQRRAIFHYITQTLFRVPRYRIYLVLYGGAGLAIAIAGILRFSVVREHVQALVSVDGLRASIGIAAFWAVAGLRLAFLSPGNRQGRWIFDFVHGRPPELRAGLEQLRAARIWALVFVAGVTGATFLIDCAIAPPELLSWRAIAAEALVASGMCLILTDLFFLHVTTVAFTGGQASQEPNPALALAKCFTFFPIVVWLSVFWGPWIEESVWRFVATVAGLVVEHLLTGMRHRATVREHCQLSVSGDYENTFILQIDFPKYEDKPQGFEMDPDLSI